MGQLLHRIEEERARRSNEQRAEQPRREAESHLMAILVRQAPEPMAIMVWIPCSSHRQCRPCHPAFGRNPMPPAAMEQR